MKVAIIGGGFTGLSCAFELLDKGVEVDLYEGEEKLGGLAGGFKPEEWLWSLEYFYHHVFTNDKEIIDLAKKVGWPVQIHSPRTTSFVGGKEKQLDSPLSLLKFSEISVWGRIRMGAGLALLKIIPNGLFLEKYRVVDMLPKLIGVEGYGVIWERLLKAKFGVYSETVNMAWFWTRVAKRTSKLGYFKKGFEGLAEKIGEKIIENGGKVVRKTKITKVEKKSGGGWRIGEKDYQGVVLTVPAPVAEKILGIDLGFPKIEYLWGQTLVLELEENLIDGYWMNILEKDWPFLVVVEQTKMINKKNYGGKNVVYLGNYLQNDSKQLEMEKDRLLDLYEPFLKKIKRNFENKWVKHSFLFRKPYSQPVFPINYGKMIPKMKSDLEGLYLANMSMVYPFDRGTNYAVKMGKEVADRLIKDLK